MSVACKTMSLGTVWCACFRLDDSLKIVSITHEIRGRTAGSHRQDFSWALIIDHDFLDFSLCLKCAPFLVSLFNSPCKFVYQNNVRISQVCHSKNTLLELSVSNCKNKYKDNNVS